MVDRKDTMAPSGRGGSLPYSEGHVWVDSSIAALYMSLLLHISKKRNNSGNLRVCMYENFSASLPCKKILGTNLFLRRRLDKP